MAALNDVKIIMESIHFSEGVLNMERIRNMFAILKYKEKIPIKMVFRHFYYGPDSDEINIVIPSLVGGGFIKENKKEVDIRRYEYDYELTDEGKKIVQEIIDDNQSIYGWTPKQIQNKVKKFNKMDSDELSRLAKSVKIEKRSINESWLK